MASWINLPQLYLNSHKDYVDGFSICEGALRGLFQEHPELEHELRWIQSFRVNDFVKEQLKMEVLWPGERTEAGRPVASMSLILKDKRPLRIGLHSQGEAVSHKECSKQALDFIENVKTPSARSQKVQIKNLETPFDHLHAAVKVMAQEVYKFAEDKAVTRGISWAYVNNYFWPQGDLTEYSNLEFCDFTEIQHQTKQFVIQRLYVSGRSEDDRTEMGFFIE